MDDRLQGLYNCALAIGQGCAEYDAARPSPSSLHNLEAASDADTVEDLLALMAVQSAEVTVGCPPEWWEDNLCLPGPWNVHERVSLATMQFCKV